MERCEELADDLDAGRASPELLLAHVEQLRSRFDSHARFEERAPHAPVLHAHRQLHAGSSVTITDELRAVIDRMRAHLFDDELA